MVCNLLDHSLHRPMVFGECHWSVRLRI